MTTNSSKSPNPEGSENKPAPPPVPSTPVEPHELAGLMTPEQRRMFLRRLMEGPQDPDQQTVTE